MQELGLNFPIVWLPTLGFAVTWLALMLAYSPLADRIATRWTGKPPALNAFRGLQQSRLKLILGIVIAWVLGGFLEEIVFRGVILQFLETECRGTGESASALVSGSR